MNMFLSIGYLWVCSKSTWRWDLEPVFEPPVWSRPWDISFTHAELSLPEKLEEPVLVGTEHPTPSLTLAPIPH